MLLAAAAIYVFATNSQVIWLYLVSALIAGLALVGLVAPAMVVRRLRPRFEGHRRQGFEPPLPQDRGRVFAGDTVTLLIDLGEDQAPVAMGPVRLDAQPTSAATYRLAGRRALVTVMAGSRGVTTFREIRATSSWPLGMATAERWIAIDHTVVVHPRYLLPHEEQRRGIREPAGAASRRGGGDEFLGLREYRTGDSQRRIHWPTSARTGVLMVVETAQESSNSSNYQLDMAGGDAEATELAVGIAASLGAGNVAAGIPMSMAIPGQAHGLHRWQEALAALATARAGQPTAGRRGRDTVRIVAGREQVTVSRGDTVLVLDVNVGLEEAVDTLGGGG